MQKCKSLSKPIASHMTSRSTVKQGGRTVHEEDGAHRVTTSNLTMEVEAVTHAVHLLASQRDIQLVCHHSQRPNKPPGEITTNREEILKICANFYKSLYTQTVPTAESTMKSIPDTEEIPEFTEEEVERAVKRMKRHKAQGVDGITSDIIKLGGPMVLTYLTSIFNNILRTKQIPDSWHEAKIVILFKKGDPKDIKNYRPISLLSHSYKIFTRLLQTRIERTLDENQPREQAGFRKGYSTTDHLQALNQIIEKSNEYSLPLCIGFIDYETAFDTVGNSL